MSKTIIFMAVYNGEKYLGEQIESIISQSHPDWSILASDDGSSDDTLNILHAYQQKLGCERLKIFNGPRQGFAKNFISLIQNNLDEGEFFAFSDQDDVWKKEKLSKAIKVLSSIPSDVPAIYCGRTLLVDEDNNFLGYSPLFKKKPSFANALVQSIAGGNTMVFNQSALNLLKKAQYKSEIVSHDWWAYMLITGAGGMVYYDKSPSILYRQHQKNLIGSNKGIFSRLKRLIRVAQGNFKQWNDLNLICLQNNLDLLTSSSQNLVHDFCDFRQSNVFNRVSARRRLNLYRQTFIDNIALTFAFLFKKI
jgi:glycosyltransferase involved in cell wall biosynthesis